MKKVISALIVVILVAIGAVYFASNEVEKNYQRIVNDLNNIKGFKISNNNYKKGFFGSKGSFDFSVSKDLLENIFGKNVNEDLVFKVENEISHTVLAFIDGFEIDSKISIQNDMIKNIIATFMGSNVIATTKTKVSLTGDKDVDIKFSNIEFNDKQKTAVNTKDIKIGMTLDSKDSINSLKVEADKIALKDFSEYNKVDLNIEGFYIDSSYKEPVKISKILESQLVPYLAKVKFKRVSFASNDVSSILIDDFKYDSKFEISNDLGRSDDVIKIGIVAVDKVKYNDVESKGITKAEIKDIQENLQSGNKKADIFNFKKDVNTISISKQIGKQAMVNGTMGLGIGMATNIGINLITGKEVEAEEVIEAGIKTGASMGMATAVAGGIRVAVEKKVIPTVFSRMLTNNTIGAIAASSMDIIGTAFKLGSGEITLGQAVKDVGNSLGAGYGAIVASGWGYAGGMAIAGMIGLGTIGAVGTILGVGVAVVAGAVCATVGSKVAGAIANGIGTVAEAIVDGAVGIVKAGKEVVKSLASGIWNGVKAVGSAVVSGVTSVVSGVGSAIGSVVSGIGSTVSLFCSGVASFFGW